MNVRSTTLTAGAFFALSVSAANAAVVWGDGSGAISTTPRTPAVAGGVKHHTTIKHKGTVTEAPSLLPDNYYQVKRNLI